ncbi:family 16 glycosylhydrolase [Nocardioides sp. zg-1230]|uniref:glycoside hydrolase family 16 protein n=1 Tax=Nocardioides sp. zg-1230 TaxID=2736601 RepID=UPI0015552CB0|nr:glycoside hydrolase family 16 protein [Nocardioides sp. zg-1230]NPC44059.1 glycoside hydrolase family 16 protein [Nocardioides sp. zg-1230]
MSARRPTCLPTRRSGRLAACLVTALVLPASLLAWSPAGSATDTVAVEEVPASTSVRSTGHQRIRLEALPQVVQPGGAVASPAAARAAVVATLRPVRPGRRVQLQVQEGESWRAVATKRQDRRGRAQFAAAAASADGEALTYRVKAMASASMSPVRSTPVSTARWLRATWTDEFDGSQLDPVWNHRGREYAHGSRRSCAKGDPSAVSVGGGAVRLSVVKDPDATTRCRIEGRDARAGRFAYRLNGHIGTQHAFAFRYGVAAARVKFHRLRGQHGAFWLQPADGMHAGALGSEIDVVEYFGDRHPQGGLASFMHRYEGKRRIASGGWIENSRSFLTGRRDGWSKNYHVFSVEWTPRMLVFRIDGKETGRMRGKISAVPQFPILSLIAANYEIPKIKEMRLPQHMYVDWVRVWETGGEPAVG